MCIRDSFFIVLQNPHTGRPTLVTASLDDKVILEGVTRASILQLAREQLNHEIEVEERKFTMREVADAVAEGRVVEAFAAGTAYFVAPISLIEWKGAELAIPMEEGHTGRFARILGDWMREVMYGAVEHEWATVVEEVE